MRVAVLLAFLTLAVPAAARQQLDTLTPAQAISRAGAHSLKPVRAVFQFKVQSAAKTRYGYYLNSEKDFRSSANLAIAVKASAMPGITRKFGDDLKGALVGKTVKIVGVVRHITVGPMRAHRVIATQVDVTHAGQILSVS